MRKVIYFILFFLFISCSNHKIHIDGFDSYAWKKDINGCVGTRGQYFGVLLENEPKLIGGNKNEIIDLLGKPDWDKHNTFGYFIQHGMQCNGFANKDSWDSLDVKTFIIRFDSLGKAEYLNAIQ